MSHTSKLILITGGASGIGLATAQLLHTSGALISIADLDDDALSSTTAYFNSGNTTNTSPNVFLRKTDVSKRSDVDSWVSETLSYFHREKIDGAANVAGVIGKHHGLRAVEEIEDDQWDLVIGVNLTGMMYCLRAQLRAMNNGGSVVCVSSVQGVMGFARHAAYSASKHGIIGLARSAAKEVGEREIRVNVVTPGSINTPLMQKRNALPGVDASYHPTPINRLGTSEECGFLIRWLLGDESKFITGAVYSVDGGWAS